MSAHASFWADTFLNGRVLGQRSNDEEISFEVIENEICPQDTLKKEFTLIKVTYSGICQIVKKETKTHKTRKM